mgnify:CR=1 FL=1
MNYAIYFGLIAGICTTISFLPQVLKIWKTKSVNDISLVMFVIFTFGVANWLIYGLIIKELPVILANAATLLLCLLILTGIIKFRK